MNTRRNDRMRKLTGVAGVLVAVSIALTGWAPASYAETQTAHARLTAQAVNDVQRVLLKGGAPLLAQTATDKGRLSSGEALTGMKLVLQRGTTERVALKDYLDQLQSPTSANFHKWLTPETFGERFGASDEDIAAITAWLQGYGFNVDGVAKSRTVITFSGTEAQFESAFHAEMHRYQINGEIRVANSANPSIPSALSPAIVGIATLGNAKFRPLHTKPTIASRNASGTWSRQELTTTTESTGVRATPQFTSLISGSYYPLVGPWDFAEMYGVKPLWTKGYKGSGQSIAIVAESNIAKTDVDAFRKAFGLPATKLNVIVIGDDPGLDSSSGAEGEAALDVQWAGALAPEATINLLVAASTATEEGILIAAEYAIENNLSPILNVSWGACELGLQDSGNQYFNDLWAQAAAQGISVMVSSGDAGSVACDQNQYYSNYGQQVSGMASTEYNTAVGGTDLYGNTETGTSYWSKTNDPTTLQSVKSYVTESAWNDSCANPLIFLHAADFGLSVTTQGALCSTTIGFLSTGGGGGGISNCTSSDGSSQSSCTGGHTAPVWQYGFSGITATGKRQIPDVSFFSGAGLWGSGFVYCEADASTSEICVNTDGVMTALSAGGTSFAAPAFAGIVALLNEQQGTRQGNLNKYLYALASKQYADSTLATNCQSGSGADTSSCIFHDVVTGTISEPCSVGTVVDPTTSAKCTAITGSSYYGATPGYASAVGYDAATGLGSINVSNLAANWNSAVALDSASQTTHSVTGVTKVPYGTVVSAVIDVKAASGSGTPTGSAALLSTESSGSTLAVAGNYLSNGEAAVQFASLLPGDHHLYASYSGDASFGSSSSQSTSFTVVKAATTTTAAASVLTVSAPNTATIITTVKADSFALNPTGSIVYTNQTTGAVIGTGTLTSITDSSTGESWAGVSFKVTSSMLAKGSNVIIASYAGDSNYVAASDQSVTISFTPYYAVAASNSSLDISMDGTHQSSATLTIRNSNGSKVDVASLALACESITVTGLSCTFSAPVLQSDGSVTSTLILTATNPQTQTTTAAVRPSRTAWTKGASVLMLACVTFLWNGRKRWIQGLRLGLLPAALSLAVVMGGCGSSHTYSQAVTNQLAVSSSTTSYGSALTLTSAISPVDSKLVPSGNVLFYDGANLLGSVGVSSGKASLTISSLSVGTHTLTASYSGDTNFMPSTSTIATVSVTLKTAVTVAVRDTAGNASSLTLPVTIH